MALTVRERVELLVTSPESVRWSEVVAVLEALPRFVRERRRREGLSQTAVAGRIGISTATLGRFEQGQQVVSLDTAMHVIRWLNEQVRIAHGDNG